MTPKEIILANLAHRDAPRPGITFTRGRCNDMVITGINTFHGYRPKRWVEGNFEYYDDFWGNVWVRMVDGCLGGEVHHQALPDWGMLPDFTIPELDFDACVATLKESFDREPDKFHMAAHHNWVFGTARYLRKLENYLMDMALAPDEVHALNRKLRPFFEKVIAIAIASGADGYMLHEDMGTQTGLLFSPDMWDEFFKDLYTDLFGMLHDAGIKVFMHSCGQNSEIVERLLTAGVDCLQFDQPDVYDPEFLRPLLEKHQAALWSPVDIQKVMPSNDPAVIAAGVDRLFERYQGCLILKNYGDLRGIGVSLESDHLAYGLIMNRSDFTRG